MLYHAMVSNKGMWSAARVCESAQPAHPPGKLSQNRLSAILVIVESRFFEAAVLEISDNPKKSKHNSPFITSQAL